MQQLMLDMKIALKQTQEGDAALSSFCFICCRFLRTSISLHSKQIWNLSESLNQWSREVIFSPFNSHSPIHSFYHLVYILEPGHDYILFAWIHTFRIFNNANTGMPTLLCWFFKGILSKYISTKASQPICISHPFQVNFGYPNMLFFWKEQSKRRGTVHSLLASQIHPQCPKGYPSVM